MAITSTGYDGTVNEVAAAIRERHLGVQYAFGGPTDFKPTIAVGVDRTVNFAAGEAWGHHVRVVSDAVIAKQAAVVGSGSRWDTYLIRRNWSGAGGTSTVEIVQGTSAKAVAGGLNSNPGVLDDQLICLARVQAGQSAIQEVWDLRTWASKLIHAPDLAAIKNPTLGMAAMVNGVLWRYLLDATSNPAWQSMSQTLTGAPAVLTVAVGWSSVGLTERMLRIGNLVQYDGQLRLHTTGPAVQFSSDGNVSDTPICTVQGPTPDIPLPIVMTFRGGATSASAGGFQCFGSIGTDGVVLIQSGPPGVFMFKSGTSGEWSVRFHGMFLKEVI